MNQPVPQAAGVGSPCINVCNMNPHTGLCSGCYRTIDEIAAWSTMSDDEKRAVWALLEGRAVRVFGSKDEAGA